MASFLASIFGTELDKVNCSFYFVSVPPSGHLRASSVWMQREHGRPATLFLALCLRIHMLTCV